MREEKRRCILPGCDISRPVFCPEEGLNPKATKNQERIAAVRNRFYDTLEEEILVFVKDCRGRGRKIRYRADYRLEEDKDGCRVICHFSLREDGRLKSEGESIHFWREDVLLPKKCFFMPKYYI